MSINGKTIQVVRTDEIEILYPFIKWSPLSIGGQLVARRIVSFVRKVTLSTGCGHKKAEIGRSDLRLPTISHPQRI
jgi:hypothetical protein